MLTMHVELVVHSNNPQGGRSTGTAMLLYTEFMPIYGASSLRNQHQ